MCSWWMLFEVLRAWMTVVRLVIAVIIVFMVVMYAVCVPYLV